MSQFPHLMRILRFNLLKLYLLGLSLLVSICFPHSRSCVKDPLSAERQPSQNFSQRHVPKSEMLGRMSRHCHCALLKRPTEIYPLISILISGPTMCLILSIGASRSDPKYPKQILLIPVYRERTRAQAKLEKKGTCHFSVTTECINSLRCFGWNGEKTIGVIYCKCFTCQKSTRLDTS